MYNNSDELVIVLNAVESTCAVKFYTVVDTSRSPVHNTPCPLHWVRDSAFASKNICAPEENAWLTTPPRCFFFFLLTSLSPRKIKYTCFTACQYLEGVYKRSRLHFSRQHCEADLEREIRAMHGEQVLQAIKEI